MSLTSALSFGVDVCLVSAFKGEAQESHSLKREGESQHAAAASGWQLFILPFPACD